MPQLMPLFWSISWLMLIIIVLMMVGLFVSMNGFMVSEDMGSEIKKMDWWW